MKSVLEKRESGVNFLQVIVDASPYARFAGLEVISVDHERLTLTMKMPMRPEFERLPGSGQIHGGPIAAFIDTVGCFALFLCSKENAPTVEFTTNYLRPAADSDLFGTASVRKAGRLINVVDIDVTDKNDKLVAIGRGTYCTPQNNNNGE